jgi:hypothetical protein
MEYIHTKIRASNRNLLLGSLIAIAAVIIVGVLSARYLSNFFAGPQPISKEELLAVTNPDTRQTYWVNVQADNTLDTGWQQYTRRTRAGVTTSETVTASYAALLFDERALLTKLYNTTVDEDRMTYTGTLMNFPDNVRNEVVASLEAESPELTGIFLPYMLDVGDFRNPGYIGLGISGVVVALALVGLMLFLVRTGNPERHPAMRALARFGDLGDAASQINREMAAPHTTVSKAHFLQNWIVRDQNLQATRYNDVIWLYQKVTQRRVNGIPAGKTFEAVILDRHGKQMSVQGKEPDVQQALTEVFRRAPWAIAGFQAEIDKMWRTNRHQLIDMVDKRRAQAGAAQQG